MIFWSFVFRHLCSEHEVNAYTGITTLFTNMGTLKFKSRLMERIQIYRNKRSFLHNYDCRNVMWIRCIVFTIAFSAGVNHNYDHKQGILKLRNTKQIEMRQSQITNHDLLNPFK